MSSGPASTGVVSIRDPDNAKLEEWEPQTYPAATYSMSMAFEYSMVTDLRQRTRESGHLRKWQEEGNIVERWAKRCVSAGAGDPARGDMGKLLSNLWTEELSRQLAAQRGGPRRANGSLPRLCARTHRRRVVWRAPSASLSPDLAITCFSWPVGHKCDRSHFSGFASSVSSPLHGPTRKAPPSDSILTSSATFNTATASSVFLHFVIQLFFVICNFFGYRFCNSASASRTSPSSLSPSASASAASTFLRRRARYTGNKAASANLLEKVL
jgi:hypothetical protein